MKKLVECVPNFSEGRRPEVIREIVGVIEGVPGIKLLDWSADANHNRTVVTFIGPAEQAKQAAFLAARKAKDLINMEQHQGEHPRMGAVDVIPFIPIAGTTMDDCVALARELGREIGEQLGIPVYLYEAAATRPERKNLSVIRQGEYEGLRETIHLKERQPDFGPAQIHPTAGATAVGARPPLIAYNINLGTADVGIARAIARAIRGSSGGFRSIKALGVMLEDRNVAQVTINVCNYEEVPLHRVLEVVKSEASRYGVNVIGSEIVGLVPLDAIVQAASFYLGLENFQVSQILETRLDG